MAQSFKIEPVVKVALFDTGKEKGSKPTLPKGEVLSRFRRFLVDANIREVERGIICTEEIFYIGYFKVSDEKKISTWLKKQGIISRR